MPTPDAGSALRGVRVVDASTWVAGPWATQVLRWLGAEVTKVGKLIEKEPNNPRGYLGRAHANEALNNDDEALTDLDNAIRLDAKLKSAISAIATSFELPRVPDSGAISASCAAAAATKLGA